jgi:hypothetical protein
MVLCPLGKTGGKDALQTHHAAALFSVAAVFAAILTTTPVNSASSLRNVACVGELASVVVFASPAIVCDVYSIHRIIPLICFKQLCRLH